MFSRGFAAVRHDDCDVARHRNDPEPTSGFGVWSFAGCLGGGFRPLSRGLVVAAGVEGELAQEFAGGGVDDADVQVADQEQDAGSGVGAANADVVEASGVAEGDGAGVVDDVGADAVVGVGAAVAGRGFGPGVVGGGGGGPVLERAVRPAGVVVAGEGVELGLQVGEGRGGGPGGEPFLQGLLEPFDFALGLGLTGQSEIILWITVQARACY